MTDSRTPGHVYLLNAVGTDRYKIGYTEKQSIHQRVAQLSTGSPFPIKVLADMRARSGLERRLHAWLDDYRAHREWFVLPPNVAERLLSVFNGETEIPSFWRMTTGEAAPL